MGNEERLLTGWSDVPLSENGREQLRKYKEEIAYPVTDAYYSSDLERASETMCILFPDFYHKDALLSSFRELNFGVYENAKESDVNSYKLFSEFLSGKGFEQGETYDEFNIRIDRAVLSLAQNCLNEGKNSATVITHSGFIRVLMISLCNLEPLEWFTIKVSNGLGYVFELEVGDHGVQLVGYAAIE
jgi:broad specificity phosphatase PhoE